MTNLLFYEAIQEQLLLTEFSFLPPIVCSGKMKSRLPPGPPKFPLVGSLPFLGTDIREPLRKMANKYISIVTFLFTQTYFSELCNSQRNDKNSLTGAKTLKHKNHTVVFRSHLSYDLVLQKQSPP